MAIRPTEEQQAIIDNRGGGLLVSAAAGSGKTRVLVERLLDRVIRENRNIDEFLIITFTRAAAEELKSRIAQELADALEADPASGHLRRQTARVFQAQISTIHSFCSTLIRQWGHLRDLPADFVLCDEEEASVLRSRALEQVLESRYEKEELEPSFAALLDVLGAGRDDTSVAEIVQDVYDKIQSHPDPEKWLYDQIGTFDMTRYSDAGETPWGRELLGRTLDTARYWAGRLEYGIEMAREDELLYEAYAGCFAQASEKWRALETAAQESWDAAYNAAQNLIYPRLGVSKKADAELKEACKAIWDASKAVVKTVLENLDRSSEAHFRDIALTAPAMEGLIRLTIDFSQAYAQEKRRRCLMDFSDLEHEAVRLLVDADGNPTELARSCAGQYAEIMVDEYQDTNKVQNTIFSAISNHGTNLFMVGDVKQSIYRFRLADPTIFINKYETFRPAAEAEDGEDRKLTMSANFRSRPQVLHAVNDLFFNIMSKELGEVNYNEEHQLNPKGAFPEGGDCRTEYHLLDFSEDSAPDEEKAENYQMEAQYAAKRIAQLLKERFPVADGSSGTRPCRPEDFAILMRSPGSVRHHFIRALNDYGIAWSAETGSGFFEAPEVSAALAYLQVMDNPRQDVPLIAALRSPAAGFTADRLAEIRCCSRDTDFYTALCTAADAGAEDCAEFLTLLQDLRFEMGEKSSHRLIWDLYQRTDMLEIVSVMPQGDKRVDNLMILYELARRYESSGHKGLFGFLTYLRRLEESGNLRTPRSPSEAGSGVQIMSIHASKGLEFPIVLLCALGREFNTQDSKKAVLFHPELGLGAKAVDSEQMIRFSTLARKGIQSRLDREMLSEEMRLLYVAVTRAKEKLIMLHTVSRRTSCENMLKKAGEGLSCPAAPQKLASCDCLGKWVLLTAMVRPEGEVLRRYAGVSDAGILQVTPGEEWIVRLHRGAVTGEVMEALDSGGQYEDTQEPEWTPESIRAELDWVYPGRNAVTAPAKLTATQLRREEELPEQTSGFLPGLPLEQEAPATAFHRPRFAQETMGLTASQKGTAMHAVLQYIRLDRTESIDAIREEITRMQEQAFLTQEQAQSVDPEAIASFFAGPLGQQMKQAAVLHREYPFSVLVPAQLYLEEMPDGEKIMLQGVIDCWLEDEDGITLIDFKTDWVRRGGEPEKAELYRPQMEAYARALEELTGRKPSRCIIWFLRNAAAAELRI